jgi:hypothetical protein
MARKANGQHSVTSDTNRNGHEQPANDASVPTEQIPWKDAVREGKEILAREREDKLRLGEIADKVEPKYRKETLAKLAEALGISKSTLNHCRTTYRAWEGILPPGAKSTPYAVLEVLATVDDREALITADPKMSKRRAEVHRVVKNHPQRDEILSDPALTCATKARKLMSEYDAGGAKRAEVQGLDWLTDKSKGWLNKLAARNTDITGDAQTRNQPLTREQLHALVVALAAAPSLPEEMRKASDELREQADWFDSLKDEARKTATGEGRIARGPKPAASEPAQASA